MAAIRFAVPVKPYGVNGTYRIGKGRMFRSPEAEQYRTALQLGAKRAMRRRPLLTGHVEVRVWFVYPDNRSDIDGAIKGTLDAMNGIVWTDDRQVIRLEVEKRKDPDAPRVEIEIVEVTP